MLKDILGANQLTFGCTMEPGVIYEGGKEVLSPDLGTLEALSFSECALLCAGSSACQFWAFGGLGQCELTSTEPVVKQSLSSAHSGSRICGRLGSLSQGKIHLFPKQARKLGRCDSYLRNLNTLPTDPLTD